MDAQIRSHAQEPGGGRKARISPEIKREQRVWTEPDVLRFFQSHRNREADLYPSERFFLPDAVREVSSCLDVGCAAGGFCRIMRAFNPDLAYTGLDVNPEYVTLAKAAHPEGTFRVGDGVHFTTPPNSFDLVHLSGVLHLNSRYQDIVRACYAQARRYLLCDFRLTRGATTIGRFELNLDGRARPRPPLPYIVVNEQELLDLLLALVPSPASIRARGYPHPPSRMATVPLEQVLMAFFLVEKGPPKAGRPEVRLEFSGSGRER